MGVDYSANYGVGYQVKESDEILESELVDGLAEYLYNNNVNKGFHSFSVGDGNYTGDEDDYYIVVENPFELGLDLSTKKKLLDDEIKRLKLETIGEFGAVGGLYVW